VTEVGVEMCWLCGRSKVDHDQYCLFYVEEQVSITKELREENKKLKQRVKELEEEVAALEAQIEDIPTQEDWFLGEWD